MDWGGYLSQYSKMRKTMARKSSDHIQLWLEYGIDVPARRIRLGSLSDGAGEEAGIDWQAADRVIAGLALMTGDQPIQLIINSHGGEDDHARAIIGAIKQCPAPVHGVVLGRAESAAAWILQHCAHRSMDSHASLMFHMGASEKNKHNDYVDSLFVDIVHERIRQVDPAYKRSKLESKLRQDWNVYPDEALELGLIDEVLK